MKHPVQILALVCLFALVGAAGWLTFADVPVHQQEVTKTIPNDRFFD